MRLSAEQVKQGVIHPERIVRDCALRYFSESFSDDPAIMPLAIQAIETFGWNDAFEYHHPLDYLAQTEETLLWLIDRLNKMGRPTTHEQVELCRRLSSLISQADVALLMKHEQSILGLEGFLAEYREAMADRLRLMTIDSDSAWQELERLCEDHKAAPYISDFPIARAFRLCEAVARDGSHDEQILAILSQTQEHYENNPMGWMECFAAHLAGGLHLDAAVGLLVKKLREDGGDLMNDECKRSLVKVGTDAAVETICKDFNSAPWHYQLYASGALADIRSDLVVTKCLELLGHEHSGEMVEEHLIRAVLMNFASEGIEPARKITLQGSPEVTGELLGVATLTGISFPELGKWKAQDRKDAQDRKRGREMLYAPAPTRQPQPQHKPLPPVVQNLTAPAPVSPITRKQKVGRNDPCPCGSGNKFKKCCMGKPSRR